LEKISVVLELHRSLQVVRFLFHVFKKRDEVRSGDAIATFRCFWRNDDSIGARPLVFAGQWILSGWKNFFPANSWCNPVIFRNHSACNWDYAYPWYLVFSSPSQSFPSSVLQSAWYSHHCLTCFPNPWQRSL
jgi:hypothetical protein